MNIIAAGNISEGYEFIGPFQSFDAASEFADQNVGVSSWIATVISPENYPPATNLEARPDEQAQVDCEEVISEMIFDRGESFETDEGIDEEVCNQLGRDILQRIVHELSIEEFVALKALIAPPDSIKI